MAGDGHIAELVTGVRRYNYAIWLKPQDVRLGREDSICSRKLSLRTKERQISTEIRAMVRRARDLGGGSHFSYLINKH